MSEATTKPTVTLRDLISKYVNLRYEKEKLGQKHKEELAPYNEAIDKLENFFMQQMETLGVDNLSARGLGTVYRATRSSATVTDFEALKAFVLENDAWELLQARVAPTAVDAYLEDTGELPPGVNVSKVLKIYVRKDS